MASRATTFDDRAEEYWWWFGTALFLLLPADLLTTTGAVALYGIENEANPVMRWLIGQGPLPLFVAHVVVGGIAIVSFLVIMWSVRRLSYPYRWYGELAISAWIAVLVAGGVVVVVNNLLMIAFHSTLL